MRKKLLGIGLFALILAASVAKGNTENTTQPDCRAPYDNTCYQVMKDGKVVKTVKGVLHI